MWNVQYNGYTDIIAIYVTAHVGQGAADWIRGYIYQDPAVQAQLLQFRLIAEDEATGAKRPKASNLFKSAGATFTKAGVCFRATILDRELIRSFTIISTLHHEITEEADIPGHRSEDRYYSSRKDIVAHPLSSQSWEYGQQCRSLPAYVCLLSV